MTPTRVTRPAKENGNWEATNETPRPRYRTSTNPTPSASTDRMTTSPVVRPYRHQNDG